MKKTLLLLTNLFLFGSAAFSQSLDESMHANGSIRVVVAVASIVMLGLIAYMFYLDRRISKIERKDK